MKKILSLILALAAVFSLAACGPKGQLGGETSDVLKIDLLDAGYGTEFCYKLKEIFEAEHPGKTVEIKSSNTIQLSTENKILSGPTRNDVDLFITSYSDWRTLVDKGEKAVEGYDVCIEDLTEIYNSRDENGILIKDKLDEEYTAYVTNDAGQYYAIPWASGPCGFMYNKTLFDYYGWEVPETVSELESLCQQINRERASGLHGVYPIVYPGHSGSSYWSYVYNTWACQYEGLDNYKAFWQGALLNPDGSYNYTDGYRVYRQEGRLEAMKALERILGNSDYIMPGSTTYDHTQAQSNMLMGKAAIVPSGDWIEREMSGTDFKCTGIPGEPETEIGYLNTPLLDVVAGWKKYEGQTGVDPDTGLDKSVLYNRYLEAKTYAFSLGYQHLAIMTSYSNCRDLAIDFLKLLVSDRGCDIFLQYGGSPSPFKQHYTEEELSQFSLSEFQLNKVNFAATAHYITKFEMSPIRYKAGLANYNVNIPESVIPSGTSAQKIFDDEYNYAQSMWNSLLISAGIVKIT